MSRTTSARRAAQIAALLVVAPRTARMIQDSLGIRPKHTAMVTPHLDEFHDLGCIYIKAWRKARTGPHWMPVWAWQSALFEQPDAACPE